MKTLKTYRIRLTPTAHFFFGGENTFGSGDERNYLVRSRTYPQQTSLLGLLRFLMLQQKGGLLESTLKGKALPESAQALIGASSFSPTQETPYGCIQKLSAVFMLDPEGQILLPAALNAGMKLEAAASGSTWLNGLSGDAYHLKTQTEKGAWKAWSSKNELVESMASGKGERYYFSKNDIPAPDCAGKDNGPAWEKNLLLLPHDQVGIQKNLAGVTEEDGFYKQTSWRLRPGFSFAFYAELEIGESEAAALLPASDIVSFGGERALFKVEALPQTQNFEAVAHYALPAAALPQDNLPKIVLLSDTWAPETIYNDCAFAITRTTHFRHHIALASKTSRYSNFNRDHRKKDDAVPTRSARFTLLKRGSVLYAKNNDLDAITRQLEAQLAFRNIGYNYFVKIPA